MVFGSLAKGYKAGGLQQRPDPLSQFDNEDVWNLEGGVKSLFADLGLILNASAFYYEYQDKQSISLVCPELLRSTSWTRATRKRSASRSTRAGSRSTRLRLVPTVAWIDATYKEKYT